MKLSELKPFLYDWSGVNEDTFSRIYGMGIKPLELALPKLDWLGDYKNFPYFVMAALIMLMVQYIRDRGIVKEYNRKVARRSIAWLVTFIGGFVLMAFLVGVLKEYFGYARPYIALAPHVNPLYGDIDVNKAYQSFPSGHVAFTTFWVAALFSRSALAIKWALLLLVALMCWFRVAAGLHFPADVIASIIIGIICFAFTKRIVYWVFRTR